MSEQTKTNLAAWAGVAISVVIAAMSYGALAQRVTRVEADQLRDSERLVRIERMVERIDASCAVQ